MAKRPILDELVFAGVAELARLVRDGQIMPRELVQLYLDRIARLDPLLNAFRVVLADEALVDAAHVERRLASGEALSLAGVPIAVKDDTDVAGTSSMCGTGIDAGPASSDSAAVRRLRAAGAVIIGKTHLPEFGAYPMCESATWGVTRNPWDLHRTPGGSSGGSAVAVAAGMVPAAIGTDGAGSIRIPAAWCGLVGLKGQRGRISTLQAPERGYRFHGLAHVGTLTRTVADAALLHDAMTGAEPGDEIPAPPPCAPLTHVASQSPRSLRIAVSFKPAYPVPVSQQVRRPVLQTAELLRTLGHQVIEWDPDYPAVGTPITFALFMHGLADEIDRLPTPELLERRTQAHGRTSRLIPDWLAGRALAVREWVSRRVLDRLSEVDVVITPVTAKPPPRLGYWEGLGPTRSLARLLSFIPFTPAENFTGQPAMSIPTGLLADGLPEAVHLVGQSNDEHTLISLAAQIESARPWAHERPQISRAGRPQTC